MAVALVTGWLGEDFEVLFQRLEDGAYVYEVNFRDASGTPQSLRMDISEFHARSWSPDDKIDFDQIPRQLATTLLEHGAAEMPTDHYVIGTLAPSTLDGTLRDIAGFGGAAKYGRRPT